MLNKPRGKITAKTDARRATVMECFPPELCPLIHPVGRLDIDTEGLLLFTDDGSVDRRLMLPGCHIEKKYFFWAFGDISEDDQNVIRSGARLFESNIRALPAEIEITGHDVVANIAELLPERRKVRYLTRPWNPVVSGYMTLTEGKKHEAKLIIKSAGCHVCYLKRVSIGGLRLDETLAPGQYRELTDEDYRLLFK